MLQFTEATTSTVVPAALNFAWPLWRDSVNMHAGL
jgi:hypothetical protein